MRAALSAIFATSVLILFSYSSVLYMLWTESNKVKTYAEAYERAADKEKFLAGAYDELKNIKEEDLPVDLRDFLIKVKVSQFCK